MTASLLKRARRLQRVRIEFIPNPAFEEAGVEEQEASVEEAITRNAFRKINTQRQEAARYILNAEDSGIEAVDDRTTSPAYFEAWMRRRGLLANLMERLDRRERFVIRSRYALGAHRRVRTFQCLADKLGVSKERVRQLEQRAVMKLKRFAAEFPLDDGYSAALA